jgi:UDP-N-acetylglucosamine--N-acetylmuramyl-(pentapeptide) pyrophosphoryl-undecaprenol N-acetylglucosamine transferase
MRKKIVIAVGGTGGHVLPAMKIGKKLSEKFDVFYMGVGLSKNPFFSKEGANFFDIEGGGRSLGLFKCLAKNIKGILQARKILREMSPEKVIGFGSYHSFPVLAAGAYLGIAYKLFEFNVVPGRVNRLFSRGAKKVFIHFMPQKKKLHGNLVPIDFSFEEHLEISQHEARLYFGLEPDKKTILVFGGSQGAEAINQVIKEVAPQLIEEFQLLHLSGTPFCTRMDLAWAACDFAICRAGAGAMREILIYEKPAILIPYPAAQDDHQTYNANYMQNIVKGAHHVKQSELTSELLTKKIFDMYHKLPFIKAHIVAYKTEKQTSSFSHHI